MGWIGGMPLLPLRPVPPLPMLKVALTGGIATGKSHALDQFRRRGIPVLDADTLAHGVMAPETEATAAIAARFGPGVIAADGAVDRKALGPIIFADAVARRDLEAIVHPPVYRAIEAGLRAFELLGGAAFAVVDVPLLFETRHASDFDRVIVTVCPPDVQRQRLVGRGLSEAEARQRIAAQLPGDEKASRADFVIRTDGSFEETASQVDEIIQKFKVQL
jgi:dephospho-CoA kinase